MASNAVEEKKIDPVKTLTLLCQLWAHQNGLEVEEIKVFKREKKGE